MKSSRVSKDEAGDATGTVVVIDVIRAFTTAAYALAAGARDIVLVSTVEEAFDLRSRFPGSLLMGEVGGDPIEGFDFGNSPAAFVSEDLGGRRLIQRTSNGTQGMVRSTRAQSRIAGSFVCAGATARRLSGAGGGDVTYVITGIYPGADGDEDAALADYIEASMGGEAIDSAPYLKRVRVSIHGRRIAESGESDLQADLACCIDIDRFDFSMPAVDEEGLLVLRADPMPSLPWL